MNRNAILNAMEKKAKAIYDDDGSYIKDGRRGFLVVEIRDPKNPDQWDSSSRNFGTVFRDYSYDNELVINNGTNFDALAHGKIAFTRRTQKDSGTNYYQVLGYESFFPGSVLSDDGNCICAFAGFTGLDDNAIAKAGIKCYESLKRTGKSVALGADEDYEKDYDPTVEPEESDEDSEADNPEDDD